MLIPIDTLSNHKIEVDNFTYSLIHVDSSTLIKKDVKDKNGITQNNEAGVYIFVLNKDYDNFKLIDFNSEVTGKFIKGDITIGVPPFNNEKLQKDCIFYVGTAGNILSRVKEHWKSSEINGCVSLKLGFDCRSIVKDYLDIYLIFEKDISSPITRQNLEKSIRNKFGSAFGK